MYCTITPTYSRTDQFVPEQAGELGEEYLQAFEMDPLLDDAYRMSLVSRIPTEEEVNEGLSIGADVRNQLGEMKDFNLSKKYCSNAN